MIWLFTKTTDYFGERDNMMLVNFISTRKISRFYYKNHNFIFYNYLLKYIFFTNINQHPMIKITIIEKLQNYTYAYDLTIVMLLS